MNSCVALYVTVGESVKMKTLKMKTPDAKLFSDKISKLKELNAEFTQFRSILNDGKNVNTSRLSKRYDNRNCFRHTLCVYQNYLFRVDAITASKCVRICCANM